MNEVLPNRTNRFPVLFHFYRALATMCVWFVALIAHAAETNQDTPNLSFEMGNFSNWKIYTGGYFFDIDDDTYKYEWAETNKASAHHKIMNQMDTPDPIVACSDLLVVPRDLSLTARIGDPGKTEGMPSQTNRCEYWKAQAERMVYEFDVTENTTLLNYRFACVLHVPDNDNHTADQLPMFQVFIHVVNPENMQESILPCGSYSATANDANAGLERNQDRRKCPASSQYAPEEFIFRNWTSGSLNLQKFIGYHVTIEIINRDCLVDNSKALPTCPHGANTTGGHSSHGYFWAETRSLELIDKNCGLSDPTITAPEGFAKYEWKRSDGKPISGQPDQPNLAVIPRLTVSEGVTYSCTMSSDLCSAGTASTDLKPVNVDVNFSMQDSCGGQVRFTNKSTCSGDSINGYTWSFGDSTFSADDHPVHIYKNPDSYSVKLYATTKMGCEDSTELPLAIPYFPTLSVDGATSVCSGEKFTLTVLDAEVGSAITWDNGATTSSLTEIAVESKKYTVKVVDKRSCSYETEKYVSVKPMPVVSANGPLAVCLGDSAEFKARGAVEYRWNVGGDSSVLKTWPVEDASYIVIGTASNGCQASDTVHVKVNPLPVVSIKAPDEVCDGSKATLEADGAETYVWSDLFSGEKREMIISENVRFTVTGTDANGCKSDASKAIKVKPIPVLSFSGDTLICSGTIARITVAGAYDFVWDDGTQQNFFSKVLKNDTVIKGTGTTDGCKSKIEIPIYIKPSPFVYIDGLPEVCINDTLTLVAMGAESYKWASGETTDTLVSTPNVPTKYQVTGTATNGCTNVATIDVNVLKLPDVSISGDKNVCPNALAKLYANGNAKVYSWSTGSISDSINPLITVPTLFKVTGQDLHGCKNVDSFQVGIINPPVLSFKGDTVICEGTSTMIVMSGASSYEWGSANGSTAYFNAAPIADTTLYVTGWLNGCSSQMKIPIRVMQKPSVWAEGLTDICMGDSLFLSAKGAKSYLWSTGVSGEQLATQLQTSSLLRLTGEDENGCRSFIEIPVNVRLKPKIVIDGTNEVCQGAVATINASGESVLYTWDNGEMGQTIHPIIVEPTTFTVTGVDKYNCKNKATFDVKPVAPPAISYLGDTAVCVGGTIDLVGQGAAQYVWEDSIPGSEYVFQPKSNTYIKLTGIAHNCSSDRIIEIRVLTPPNILISGDTAVCPGDKFHIKAQGAMKFRWNTGDTTSTISYAPLVPTTYYATGEDVYGCSSTKEFTVKVRPNPEVSIRLIHYSGCPGSKDTAVVAADGAAYYEWTSDPSLPEVEMNFNSNKLTALLDDTTTFTLYGRDLYGCASEDKLTLTPLERKKIDFRIEPKWIENSNPTISMKGIEPAAADWYWTPMDGAETEEGRLFHHRYNMDDISDSVLVRVRAVDSMGCRYEGSEYLYVWKDFWAPTGFTPNSDEKNETFHFYGGQYISDFEYYIYNRVGEIVFVGKSFDAEWDGTFNGKPCPWGVYGWVAKYSSDVKGSHFSGERKGMITIVR